MHRPDIFQYSSCGFHQCILEGQKVGRGTFIFKWNMNFITMNPRIMTSTYLMVAHHVWIKRESLGSKKQKQYDGWPNWIINIYIFVGGMFVKVWDKVDHSPRDTRKWIGRVRIGAMLPAQKNWQYFLYLLVWQVCTTFNLCQQLILFFFYLLFIIYHINMYQICYQLFIYLFFVHMDSLMWVECPSC